MFIHRENIQQREFVHRESIEQGVSLYTGRTFSREPVVYTQREHSAERVCTQGKHSAGSQFVHRENVQQGVSLYTGRAFSRESVCT